MLWNFEQSVHNLTSVETRAMHKFVSMEYYIIMIKLTEYMTF